MQNFQAQIVTTSTISRRGRCAFIGSSHKSFMKLWSFWHTIDKLNNCCHCWIYEAMKWNASSAHGNYSKITSISHFSSIFKCKMKPASSFWFFSWMFKVQKPNTSLIDAAISSWMNEPSQNGMRRAKSSSSQASCPGPSLQPSIQLWQACQTVLQKPCLITIVCQPEDVSSVDLTACQIH